MLDNARVEMLAYDSDKRALHAQTVKNVFVGSSPLKLGLWLCRNQGPVLFPPSFVQFWTLRR